MSGHVRLCSDLFSRFDGYWRPTIWTPLSGENTLKKVCFLFTNFGELNKNLTFGLLCGSSDLLDG